MKNNLRSLFKRYFTPFHLSRIYLGPFLLLNAGVGLWIPLASLGLPQDSYDFFQRLWQMNILMYTVKAIELIAGLCFLINRWTFAALILFLPVLFNIIVMNLHFYGNVNYSVLMILATLIIIFYQRKRFVGLFSET